MGRCFAFWHKLLYCIGEVKGDILVEQKNETIERRHVKE